MEVEKENVVAKEDLSSSNGDILDINAITLDEDRNLIETLIHESDSCLTCQNLFIPVDCLCLQIKTPRVEERIGGWLETGVLKTNNGKKKKNRRRSAEDALYLPFNDYESHQQRLQVHSVDGSWISVQAQQPLPFWKSIVETDTCRYIPDNGRYRVEKSSAKIAPIKTKRPEKVFLTTEQRNLQKEIQRDLRREFEGQQRGQSNNMVDVINQLENNMKSGPVKLLYSHGDTKKSSEGPFDNDNTHHRNTRHLKGVKQSLSPTVALPPITSQGKHCLDPFMEQVSKKLSALEEEMKRDSSIRLSSRRSVDEHAKVPKQESPDKRHKPDGVIPDMFSVKQLIKNNEKKLKTRSLHIHQEDENQTFTLPSHVKYTTANGDVIKIPIFSNIHAPNTTTLINQERENFRKGVNVGGANPSSHGLENSLQTVKCKTRQVSDESPSRQKFSNTSLESASRPLTNAFPGVQVGQSRGDRLVSKTFPEQDSYPELLPKVSGKRLEVPLTYHR